jgi:hypothetical protein
LTTNDSFETVNTKKVLIGFGSPISKGVTNAIHNSGVFLCPRSGFAYNFGQVRQGAYARRVPFDRSSNLLDLPFLFGSGKGWCFKPQSKGAKHMEKHFRTPSAFVTFEKHSLQVSPPYHQKKQTYPLFYRISDKWPSHV